MSENPVVCRTCRKESVAERVGEDLHYKHLPVEAEDQHGKSVAEKIYEVSDVMVRLDHALPQVICMPCVELLEIAYNFRQQVIESNTILTNAKLGFVPIKQEPEEPEDSCEVKMEGDSENEAVDGPQPSTKRPCRSAIPDPPPKMARKSTLSSSSADKSKNRSRKFFARMAKENVDELNGRFHCRIDEFNPCNYAPKTFDACNLIRHFRKQHREIAKIKGFFNESEGVEEQKPRASSTEKKHTPVKQKTVLNAQKVLEGCLKLVTEHNFPMNAFDWAGFRILLDGLALNVNEAQIREYLNRGAKLIVERIMKEMSGRMVSIKIDSGCLRERHMLTVSSSFELHNLVMSRVLGIVEVALNETPEQIKNQLLDVLRRFNLSAEQIYAIAWDEGATIITSNRKLRKMASSSIQTEAIWNDDDENDDTVTVVLTRREELLESLATELKNDKFVTVRGAIHNLEQALGDIVDQADPNVTAIEEFVVSLRKDECRSFIESQQASLPPLWSSEQWTSKYKTIHSIIKQEWFFSTLKKDFPELDLKSSVWQFMRDHEAAFLPLHKMVKQMQQSHQPFSEFYMQWLIAIKDLRRLTVNRFSKPVTDSLTTLLGSFKQNMVFNAALYLDPRFNYFKSAVFTPEFKEEVQAYIIGVWNRINALSTGKVPENIKSATDEDDDMDHFLTEMFGGQADSAKQVFIDANCPLMQQLKGLEIEPRQPHNYDVWKHWIDRKETHAELAKVALVVLSAPTNSISLPTTFGAFFVPDQTTSGYSSKNLEDIITVKLNQVTFKKIIPLMVEKKK